MTDDINCYPIARLSLFGVLVVLPILSILNPSSASATPQYHKGPPAKYLFLFIGEGLGLAQRTAAESYIEAPLVMNSMPAHGITATAAADRMITEAAAAGTALSAGQQTSIGMIGMTPRQKPVKTLAEIARDKDQKVGIISTVPLYYAIPATFYAHVKQRNHYQDIQLALVNSGFDFFGGGWIWDPNNPGVKAVVSAIQTAGYQIVRDRTAFMALEPTDNKIMAPIDSSSKNHALPYVLDMQADDISTVQLTSKTIELLDNPKGFFILVYDGSIDWACHANDAATAIQNILAFDKAIQEAVDFFQNHPEDTLIVVTSGHETGGLALGWAGTSHEINLGLLENQRISSQKFSDEIFVEYHRQCGQNCSFESIKPLIRDYFGLKFSGNPEEDLLVLRPHEIKQIETAFKASLLSRGQGSSSNSLLYGHYNPLTVALTRCLNNKAGLGWTSFSHTGVPVMSSALGVGAPTFSGMYDNTQVAKKMMAVMGVTPKVHRLADRK